MMRKKRAGQHNTDTDDEADRHLDMAPVAGHKQNGFLYHKPHRDPPKYNEDTCAKARI